MIQIAWLIVSGVAMASAAVLLWLGKFDVAFIVATVGLVAWFLNYRVQLGEANVQSKTGEDNDREES